MNKLNFSSIGLATLGSMAAVGMATAPAQAIGISGSLEWDNGTDSFIDEIDSTDPFDTFDVLFSPQGIAASFGASGDFTVPFPTIPDLYDVDPVLGEFAAMGVAGEYELVGDLAFEFDNGVTMTLPGGAEFDLIPAPGGSVEFDLVGDAEWMAMGIPGLDPSEAVSSTFEFEQTPGADFGGYVAQADFVHAVPEPGTILGLLAVGGLGLGLKKKKQS